MPAFIDLTGQKYGKLTVIALHPEKCSSGRTQWLCRCECGNEKIIRGNDLRRGRTTSCGCNVITHGHTRNQANGRRYTPEYISWYSMRQRCKNPNHFAHKDYGGRGITICERWESFENFLKDMGPKPGPHYTIERIDVNGNYEPSNCKWGTPTEQSRNQRINTRNKTGIKGVYFARGKYASFIYVNRKAIHLGTFNSLDEATKARKEAEMKYWYNAQ